MRALRVFGVGLAGLCALVVVPAGFPARTAPRVNWRGVSLPGSVCGSARPIELRRGRAVVRTRRFGGGLRRITVKSGWDPIVYGDLDGDGLDEAALVVDCGSGGGTADSILAYAQVIFRIAGPKATVLGIVTPRVQPKGELPTLLAVTIRRGSIVAHEAFYGLHDGTCCPSGRATTIWTYTGHVLEPATPSITRRPSEH